MKRVATVLMLQFLACLTAGCASHDYRGENLLGGATEQNIQLHSVRDADLPNHQEIDGGQGGTGANAVAALRRGQSKPAGSPAQ